MSYENPAQIRTCGIWQGVAAMLFIVGLLLAVSTKAHATSFTPPPPYGVPADAKVFTECVGASALLVVACNSTWTWSRYVNTYCCTYQRDQAFTYAGGIISVLVPLPNQTDTRVTGISGNGTISGVSQKERAALPVATVWIGGIPHMLPGTVATSVTNATTVVDNALTVSNSTLQVTRLPVPGRIIRYATGKIAVGSESGQAYIGK